MAITGRALTIAAAAALFASGVIGCSAKEDPALQITNGAAATRPGSTGSSVASGSSLASTGTTTAPIPSIKAGAVPTVGNNVTIKDYAFQPVELTVKVGATVTWTNQENDPPVQHRARSEADPASRGGFDTGKLGYLDRYDKTFSQPGTYAYYCEIHNVMKGTIVVTA